MADEDHPDDLLRPLPDRLVTDLTAHRTLALRDAVASSPLVAFAAMLHALVLETFYTYATSGRSEEHTSELQSLMRISYAVFCLKKKNKRHIHIVQYVYSLILR